MTARNLWQAHYKILSIILLKEFRKLNVNMDMIITNVKHVELNTKTVSAVLNTQALKMIEQYINVYVVTRITKNV